MKRIFSIATILALTACTAGIEDQTVNGSGNNGETPPTISTFAYAEGAAITADTSGYDYIFDSDLTTSTVNTTNITMACPTTAISTSVSYTSASKTVTILPTEAALAQYQTAACTTTFGTGVQNSSSVAMGAISRSGTLGCFSGGDIFSNDTVTGSCWTTHNSDATDITSRISVTGGVLRGAMSTGSGAADGYNVTVYKTLTSPGNVAVSACLPSGDTNSDADSLSTLGISTNFGEGVGVAVLSDNNTRNGIEFMHGFTTLAGPITDAYARYITSGVPAAPQRTAVAENASNQICLCLVQTADSSYSLFISNGTSLSLS